MLFSNITLLDENLDVREGMYVRVNDGVISYDFWKVPYHDINFEYLNEK